MINANILQLASDPEFALKSLSEWADKQAEKYTTYIAMVSDAILEADILCQLDATGRYVANVDAITEFLTRYEFNTDAYVIVNPADGPVKISEALAEIAIRAQAEADPDIDLSEYANLSDIETVATNMSVALEGMAGLASAAKAKLIKGVDKLVYFAQDLASKVNSAPGSSVASYYRNVIAETRDALEFLDVVQRDMGVEELASDSGTSNVNNFKVAEYTGVSPMYGFSATAALGVVGSVAKTAFKVVAGVFVGVGNLLQKAATWVVDKINQVFVNPNDLVEVEGERPSVTGLCSQIESGFDSFTWNRTDHPDTPEFYQAFVRLKPMVNMPGGKYYNKWIKFHFITGEVLVKLHGIQTSVNDDRWYVGYTYDCQFKPYVLDSTQCRSIMYETGAQIPENFENFLRSYRDRVSYCPKNAPEVDKYAGLEFATALTAMIVSTGVAQITAGSGLDTPYSSVDDWSPWLATSADYNDNITNNNFVWAASQIDGSSPAARVEGTEHSERILSPAELIGSCLGMALIAAWDEEELYPMNHSWIPYSNGITNFESSYWRVVTDAENIQALHNFAATVITIALVVSAAIFIGVKLRKLRNNINTKRLEYVRKFEQNLTSEDPTPTTSADQKKYFKYVKKLGMANAVTGALSVGTAETVSTIMTNTADQLSSPLSTDTMYRVIVGTNP